MRHEGRRKNEEQRRNQDGDLSMETPYISITRLIVPNCSLNLMLV